MLSGTGVKKPKTDRRPAPAAQEAVRAAQDAAVLLYRKRRRTDKEAEEWEIPQAPCFICLRFSSVSILCECCFIRDIR